MDYMDLLELAMGQSGLDSYISGIIDSMIGVLIILSIPTLIFAIAYCFFGIKIYRILLAINAALIGGTIGAIILGIVMESTAGVILGFLLFGAIFAALAWFFYKVFIFIDAFLTGFGGMAMLLMLITKNMTVSLIIGVIAGIALGVLIIIYLNIMIMAVTAFKGAGTIASVISLFFWKSGAHSIIYLLLLLAFTVGGFYVQYRFFGDIDFTGNNNSANKKGKKAGCKLVGIEGMYKGFEFDLDNSITFGRDVDNCNIIFPDTCAGVSRIQCQVYIDRVTNGYFVVDKYSSYGTTLNGVKLEINKVAAINDGDVIMFGENNVFKVTF